ncbi:uncharacterized protein BKA55DRAFT_600410 [Fusarium redolens]|uniref:Uncharacterized protein n=1 Tax=Fusarium redolens TaxID=48865 RepID=A0A9P9JK34_FUSRE|nr:uncharacterized protein BKA55DRAFT_600410 [Fusarium redolens]KAH7204876.1 hypothetical protein BKA55DRAFT_600410 [Fusarium redolens]
MASLLSLPNEVSLLILKQCLESILKSESLSQSVREVEICTSYLLPLDEVEEIELPYCEYESMMKSLKGKVIPDSLVEHGIDYDDWYKKWHINNAEVESSDEEERDDESGSLTRNRLEQLNMREYQRHLYDQADMMRTGYDVVFTAIAASGISVELLNIEPNSMLMEANRINPFMLMGPSSAILSKSSPASLRQLRISLDPESPLDDTTAGRKWGPDLIRFMYLLPKLSDLELNFQPRDKAGRFSEIAKELYIPTLKRISLICIDTAAEDLAILLMRHYRTLETVDLDNIQLSGALTSWRWLIEIVWSSLNLERLCITSSQAEREAENSVSKAELDDIEVVGNDSLTAAINMLISK